MTEQQNQDLIERVYGAFAAGDVQTILDHLTPDVEWVFEAPPTVPFSGHRAGVEPTRGFFDALATTQDHQKLTIDEFLTAGDKVIATGRYTATVKATGHHIDSPICHVFTVTEGKISRYMSFADTAGMAQAYSLTAAPAVAAVAAGFGPIPIQIPPVVNGFQSPLQGMVWHVGNQVEIQFFGLADRFNIRLSFDGGQAFMQIGQLSGFPRPGNGYSFSYTVPNHLTQQAQVRVEALSTVNGVEQRAHADSGIFTIAPHK